MRGIKCALVAGTMVAWLLAVPGLAQAAPVDEPAAPALTVEQTPVTVRTVVSTPESITVEEFLKRRAASARALPIADPLRPGRIELQQLQRHPASRKRVRR